MRTLTNALGAIVPALVLALAPCNPAATVVVGQPAAGGGGPSYVYEQDFETTGAPTGWSTVSGTPDYDYATAPAPLEGSESLHLDSTEQARSQSWSALGDCYAYFQLNLSTASSKTVVFEFEDSGAAFRLRVEYRASGVLRVYHGTASTDGSTTLSAGTTYHVWVEYEKGTGSDGVARLYYSTSAGTKTLEATVATGTATDDIVQCAVLGATNATILDDLIIDSSAIGTNP